MSSRNRAYDPVMTAKLKKTKRQRPRLGELKHSVYPQLFSNYKKPSLSAARYPPFAKYAKSRAPTFMAASAMIKYPSSRADT